MAKFRRYDGIGKTAITINGKICLVGGGETIDVSEADPIFDFLKKADGWEKIDSTIIYDENKVIEVEPSEHQILTIEDLTAIKGVGKATAEKILEGKVLSWIDLKERGLEYFKDILKDDIAEILWQKIVEEVEDK